MATPSHQSCSATQLLLEASHGDAQAFGRLYQQYRPAVCRFMIRRWPHLASRSAEDLVQEVFLRAWARRESFRGGALAETFLLGIAKNVCLEWQAHDQRWLRQRHQSYWEYLPASATRMENQEFYEKVCQRLTALSGRQQRAIQLVVLEGKTLQEAASIENSSCQAIRRRVDAARVRLRQSLARCGSRCVRQVRTLPNCPAERGQATCLRYLHLVKH